MNSGHKAVNYVYNLYLAFWHQKELYENRESDIFLKELRQSIGSDVYLNMTEVHVISCVGQHEPINLTAVAERMDISKGNVSKIAAKLVKDGWLRKTQLNDNKKEIYFRLTQAGKRLFAIHEEQHEKEKRKLSAFFERYCDAELDFAQRLFSDLIAFYREGEN